MIATALEFDDLVDAGPLAGETLVSLPKAARAIRTRSGKPAHVNMLRRWEKRGIYGVKLETAHVGGRVYTSVEALRRFSAAARKASRPVTEREPTAAAKARDARPRSDAERREAARKAVAELARRKRIRAARGKAAAS